MTAVRFEGCCPHAPGDEAFQIGLDGSVFRGYDVPAWLGSPSGSFNLLIEEIRSGRRMCCPDEFLLMLWQITRKRRNTVWFQPNTSICHRLGKKPRTISFDNIRHKFPANRRLTKAHCGA